MLRDLLLDVRYGLRGLRRNPGLTLLVVLSLGLGMGANAAMFSVVNAVLLRPLPVRDLDGLLLFSQGFAAGRMADPMRGRVELYSHPFYRSLAADQQAFAALAAEDSLRVGAVVRWTGPVEESSGDFAFHRYVSGSYFEVLGVRAALGRTFLADEDREGADPVVVLSHQYWQRRFGGAPAIVGAALTLNGRRHTVVGVTPPGFVGLDLANPTDLWVPFSAMTEEFRGERSMLGNPRQRWLNLLGRARPGVSRAAAEEAANLALGRFIAQHPGFASEDAGHRARIQLEPGGQGAAGLRSSYRASLLLLLAGVGVLLLIVCLNVSQLLLTRALQRARELGIRTALGASRARLVRQLLTEGLLLAALGTGAGLLLRQWLGEALLALFQSTQPSYLTLVIDLGTDGRVLAFTAAVSVFTALALGLVPAWQAGRADPQQALRATARSVAGGRRVASRVLLAVQVALSVVLLAAAGLLAGTLRHLRGADTGLDMEHVLLMRISTEFSGLDQPRSLLLQEDLLRRVRALSGVRAASLSYAADPMQGGVPEVFARPDSDARERVQVSVVTPGYFDTLGLTVLRGRDFTTADRGDAPRVVVINQTLADRLFAGEEAVGRRVRFLVAGVAPLGQRASLTAPAGPRDLEIVGVLRDWKTHGVRRPPRPVAYVPAAQTTLYVGSLEVRSTGDPATLAGEVRRAVLEANPNLPVRNVRTLRTHAERSMTSERFLATLSTAFGLAALLLVCLGLYGVVGQWAAQRTPEIGVRMALGATAGSVRWLVLRQGFLLVLVGVAVGLPAALVVGRLLRRFLFGLQPTDPATLGAVALVMLLVAALAAFVPARRASRVDPMAALRSE